MMLGLLLARAGIETVVVEKHADFLRDFRGDTIHPSTLEAMQDLGFLDDFLNLPHQEARFLEGKVGDVTIRLADFSHLPTRAKFVAFMPQWDFLDFLAAKARTYSSFRLIMRAELDGLIEEEGRIAGVTAKTPEGRLEIRADLIIGADGRHSIVRKKAGFAPLDIGAPIDVLWFRLSHRAGDSTETFGRLEAGQMLVLINRGEHWQCGYVIAKGSRVDLEARGIDSLRQKIAGLAPFLTDRVGEIASWDDVKLLTVAVDRLPVWHRPGLLCIGDAAHAMSPVGGVGINLAIQDAIATANILAGPLLHEKGPVDSHFAEVQKRRAFAVKATQAMQVFIQNRVISNVLGSSGKIAPPWFLRLFNRLPILQRLPGRLIGLGFRPERITAPELRPVRAERGGTI
jgi:2-polyprenyl-6-methoxyphenol hydroxylase-like FAD-dependent oxidoreductase